MTYSERAENFGISPAVVVLVTKKVQVVRSLVSLH
jgi:hypothetical protein